MRSILVIIGPLSSRPKSTLATVCTRSGVWPACARLYFAAGAQLGVMQIDPRRLGCDVRVAATPRGPMPHVHGAIPRAAIVRTFTIDLGDQSLVDPLGDAPDALG